MSYKRVLPRDLFNEGKLLSHIGKWCLLIHDEAIEGLNVAHEDSGAGFQISQLECGGITISNLYFFDNNGTPVYFHYPLNCKENNHLIMTYKDEEYYPFHSDGHYFLDRNIFKGE